MAIFIFMIYTTIDGGNYCGTTYIYNYEEHDSL